MKNSTSETSLIKDIAIYDYVANQQSEGSRDNFEKSLNQDTGLMQDVAVEEQLRSSLEHIASTSNSEPVSMKNFDALLERIELDESELTATGVDEAPSQSNINDNVIVVQPWRWQRQFNIAASFAFIAMIGVIGFNQAIEPNFTTLSNETASADIDFAGLVEQQRLIKLEFSQGIASSDIASILDSYQLSSIQSGALGQVVLVSAKQSVDADQLALWGADKRIITAELVAFGSE